MKQRNIKHEKRLKKLVLTCLLLAVVLTVGTYAWFIGMQTVSVEAFEVKIAAVEDLALSIDASTWGSTLTISEDALKNNDYAKTTYAWTSLKPVSTVGVVNADTSKMVMYDKGSLTATDGGYRLMSALVTNAAATRDESTGAVTAINEQDGYVAFDLFIKNMSGDAYYGGDDASIDKEEAIYLDRDSKVTAGSTGYTNSGIQNSVRIAFAQIGHVKSDAAASLAQQIDCKVVKDGVTTLCSEKTATIYEPNDTKHTAAAIKWYDTTCFKRTNKTTYDTAVGCKTITDGENTNELIDGKFLPTYAVSGVIDETAQVDVYDGLNGYSDSVSTSAADNKLVAVDTFTDTERDKVGTARPEFFTLAPNSITKVRVYLYLEGQDVDNFDFASLGYSISAQFGFTKERFTPGDSATDPIISKSEYDAAVSKNVAANSSSAAATSAVTGS